MKIKLLFTAVLLSSFQLFFAQAIKTEAKKDTTKLATKTTVTTIKDSVVVSKATETGAIATAIQNNANEEALKEEAKLLKDKLKAEKKALREATKIEKEQKDFEKEQKAFDKRQDKILSSEKINKYNKNKDFK